MKSGTSDSSHPITMFSIELWYPPSFILKLVFKCSLYFCLCQSTCQTNETPIMQLCLLWVKCYLANAFSTGQCCAEVLSRRAIITSADSQPSMRATHLILLASSVVTIYIRWMDGGGTWEVKSLILNSKETEWKVWVSPVSTLAPLQSIYFTPIKVCQTAVAAVLGASFVNIHRLKSQNPKRDF